MAADSEHSVALILTPGADRFEARALFKRSRFQTVTLVQELATGQQRVARLLMLPPGATEVTLLQGLDKEQAILKKLQHPNLPRFDKVVEGQGGTWLLFHYEPGADLSQYIRIESRVSTEWILWWLSKLLQTLHALHTNTPRLVVGYFEPSDVVVRDDQLFLVDIGIFEDVFPQIATLSRHSFVNFIAPERRTAMLVSPATDLFSAGAIAFWLCTGRAPIASGPEASARMREVLRQKRPDLHDRVAKLIVLLLDPQPDRRPPNAATALQVLEPHVRDMTGQLPPIALENTDHQEAAVSTRSIAPPPEPVDMPKPAAPAATRVSPPARRPMWVNLCIGLAVLAVVILAAAPRTAPETDSSGRSERVPAPTETVTLNDNDAKSVQQVARRGGNATVAGDTAIILSRHKSVLAFDPGSHITQLSPANSNGPQFSFVLESGDVRARTGGSDSVEVRMPDGKMVLVQGNSEAIVRQDPTSSSVTCNQGAVYLESATTRVVVPAGKTHDL